MRAIWTSNPRSPSTNDGPRALVLSYGFQKRAIAILKRLTLVTLFLHVRRAVHLKEGRSAPHTPSRLAPLTAKRLSEIQYSTFRKILCYCERRASPNTVHLRNYRVFCRAGGQNIAMARTLASLPTGSRVTDYISLGVVSRAIPREKIDSILASTGKASVRQRELPAHLVVYYVI